MGQGFEEAGECATHAYLDLGDAEREGMTVFSAVFLVVFPHQVYVVDADDLVAMDVDDLLVEQVALEQKEALVVGLGGGIGGLTKLHGAGRGELELGDRDQRGAVRAVGPAPRDDDSGALGGVA